MAKGKDVLFLFFCFFFFFLGGGGYWSLFLILVGVYVFFLFFVGVLVLLFTQSVGVSMCFIDKTCSKHINFTYDMKDYEIPREMFPP